MEFTYLGPVGILRISNGEFVSSVVYYPSPWCPFGNFLGGIIWLEKRNPVLSEPVKTSLAPLFKICIRLNLVALCFFHFIAV